MAPLTHRLIQTATAARRFLENDSRRAVAGYILSRQNPDGGFCGRGNRSDLYYTFFAAASLRALGGRIPGMRLWRYVRSFGDGADLDLVHLVCLIRLRSAFPMSQKLRRKLSARLNEQPADSAYDFFIKRLADDDRAEASMPEVALPISSSGPTTTIAAASIVNRRAGDVRDMLLQRWCPQGGFSAGPRIEFPDLLSTATALFAFSYHGWNCDELRPACLQYIESLWCDSGGFAGHAADGFEDVEYTFYALLSIGCLMP